MKKNYPKFNNYDLRPIIEIEGYDSHAFDGYEEIIARLKRESDKKRTVLVFDCYAGVDTDELVTRLTDELKPCLTVRSEECALSCAVLNDRLEPYLTDDRVFGCMCHKTLDFLFDSELLEKARGRVDATLEGVIVIVGVGASLIADGDLTVLCDLPRWEIQNRYKRGLANFCADNAGAPFLSKYKRGFFVEWRMLDKRKKELINKCDYCLDTVVAGAPKMLTGEAFRAALKTAAARPFRTMPYFDPGVWGGQWMRDVCGLDKNAVNFAWAFDGVPEENSVNFRFGKTLTEYPCINIVLFCPEQLLGERVFARFGAEFPIRFDFLDTMDGGNLSLQVHPLTGYIQQKFGMNYTQDESYYILDCAEEGASVCLGVKTGCNGEEMRKELEAAQRGECGFDAEKYVNIIPVKKHDHILIPAGTVHCSCKNSMVLEISATPYIFTFKLWDWGRLGLDGLPRPIHIEHGMANIQFNRDSGWVMRELVNSFETLTDEPEYKAVRTGLHRLEFIETVRHEFSRKITLNPDDSLTMLNVVSGSGVTVTAVDGSFKPFTAHYAETFIVPASVGTYCISPMCEGETVAVIAACVR